MPATFDSTAIAQATAGVVLRPGPSGPITANHLTMAQGEWFVALAGEGFDDHVMVPEAARRGVAGVMVTSPPPDGLDVPAVLVDDTWRALRCLGLAARERFEGPVVGISGSVGKTTTRALTALTLTPLGRVHQTEENQNHEPGVPLTLLQCPDDAAAQVIELGTSRPGELERLSQLVAPSVRLLVNVGAAHLARLGDLAGVLREKRALFDTARPEDVCVVNLDDPLLAALTQVAGIRRVTFGRGGHVELLQVSALPGELALRARWQTPVGEVTARLPTPAPFVAANAAAALAVAWSCGVPMAAAAAALEAYEPVGMRLAAVHLPGGVTVLNDAFNASPKSMSAALRVLASMAGRRVAVLGDMLELGEQEAAFHDQILELAGSLGLQRLVLVGPRMAAASARCGRGDVHDGVTDVVASLRAWLAPGDIVLLKGSRGMRLEGVLQGLSEG